MNKANLLKIYKNMLLIRILEEKISQKYNEQEMRCPVHLSIGQEAIATGICSLLKKKDIVFSNHRSHAHYIAKNCNIEKMLCELYGKANGCLGGRGGSMHLQEIENGFFASIPIVSSALGPAVGVALNLKRKKSKNICVVFVGDGALEEGIFHETMNFISLNKLPLLIVCENNLFSVYTNIKERQINDSFLRYSKAFKIKGARLSGNDVIKINLQTKKIINSMKKNHHPFFMQLDTYRWLEHCGPNYDNHIGYRSVKEFDKWKKKCPINKLEKLLIKKNILDKNKIYNIRTNISNDLEKKFTFAKNSKFPNPDTAGDFVYKKI